MWPASLRRCGDAEKQLWELILEDHNMKQKSRTDLVLHTIFGQSTATTGVRYC